MTGRRGGRGSATELERRYRRWLLAYPAGYRRERGDELVATLLDLAGPGRRRPRPVEVIALLRHGLLRRLDARLARWVEAWRPARRGATCARLGLWLAAAPAALLVAFSSDDPGSWDLAYGFGGGWMLLSVGGGSGFPVVLVPGLAYPTVAVALVAALPVLVGRRWSALLAAVLVTAALVFVAVRNLLVFDLYFLPVAPALWMAAVWLPWRSAASRGGR